MATLAISLTCWLAGIAGSLTLSDDSRQATGVKVGEVTDTSAIVWMRLNAKASRRADGLVRRGRPMGPLPDEVTTDDLEGSCPGAAGLVRLRYGLKEDLSDTRATEWVEVKAASDFTHQFRFTNLKPGSIYFYSAETTEPDGAPRHAPLRGQFETAPPTDRRAEVTFTVVTGQAYKDIDHPDGFHIYESMARLKPKFIVPTGDTVYYDSEDPRATTVALARYHWHRMYGFPRHIAFHLRVPGYWEKDDHDTVSDDCWPTLKPQFMLPMTHRFHRVNGGFLSVSVRPAREASDIAFRFHDVHGEVVYESVRTQQDRTKAASTTRLGTHAVSFTINGKPTFLRGVSYYGALGAAEESIRRDLADMKRLGFNWIRVWATWAAFGNDVSAVDTEGKPRGTFLSKLQWLVAECDRQGIVVDVTLSRGNGTTGPARLQSLEAHRLAVETVTVALKPYRNWYLDLANERNIRDKRFVSFDELKDLRSLVRQLDPERLVTASHAGDIGRGDLREYLVTVGVDFVSPHRPRNPTSPDQTESKSREYLAWMHDLNRVVPLHYQEPFRRGFNPKQWEPPADAFLTDLKQAIAGGAAGWCFHNGDQKDNPEARPRRSFDLRDARLFEQLDEQERAVLEAVRADHP